MNSTFYKPECPFTYLFKCLSPKDFANLFNGEADQTIAFLLSFSRNRKYAKKVLKILNDEDTTNVVSSYLKTVSGEGIDLEFVKKIETYLKNIMKCRKDLSSSRSLRKNIFIRNNKFKVPKGETEDKSAQEGDL